MTAFSSSIARSQTHRQGGLPALSAVPPVREEPGLLAGGARVGPVDRPDPGSPQDARDRSREVQEDPALPAFHLGPGGRARGHRFGHLQSDLIVAGADGRAARRGDPGPPLEEAHGPIDDPSGQPPPPGVYGNQTPAIGQHHRNAVGHQHGHGQPGAGHREGVGPGDGLRRPGEAGPGPPLPHPGDPGAVHLLPDDEGRHPQGAHGELAVAVHPFPAVPGTVAQVQGVERGRTHATGTLGEGHQDAVPLQPRRDQGADITLQPSPLQALAPGWMGGGGENLVSRRGKGASRQPSPPPRLAGAARSPLPTTPYCLRKSGMSRSSLCSWYEEARAGVGAGWNRSSSSSSRSRDGTGISSSSSGSPRTGISCGRAAKLGRASRGPNLSNPAAITVTLHSSPRASSITAPKMMLASGCAARVMVSAARLASWRPRSEPPAIESSRPLAPSIDASSSGEEIAARAASSARFSPAAPPTPINADPAFVSTVRTSAKSRLMRPGVMIRLVIPSTPWYRTWSAMRNASRIEVSGSEIWRRRSLGTMISVSTDALRSWIPWSAWTARRCPSKENGRVTTPIVSEPSSRAMSATTGAPPVPVPPPSPAVTNTMSAPLRISSISSRCSSEARRPMSGSAPDPSPRVVSRPMSSFTSASDIRRACASVLIAMNSTPLRPASIIRLTALTPPPPMPTTLITAR